MRSAVSFRSASNAASATVTWSRPSLSASIASLRVDIQRTGRPSSRAAKATAKYSG